MAIQVHWYDHKHTILYWDITDKWGEDDLINAYYETNALLATASRQVDIIVNLETLPHSGMNALLACPFNQWHKNMGAFFVIASDGNYYVCINMRHVERTFLGGAVWVDDLDEALNIMARLRRKTASLPSINRLHVKTI